jgi:hypothetical protein
VLGVLAVDSRDGTMMGRVSFLSTGEDESVVWLTASRRDKDETTVTCVTSAGSLWRFRLNTSLVTMSDAVHYDTLLEGLGSEASPMEDLVLAMGVEDHDRPATNGDGSGTSGAGNGGQWYNRRFQGFIVEDGREQPRVYERERVPGRSERVHILGWHLGQGRG